jgi:peptidoglycan/LPS O-acetylase OafA/YrhL
MRAAALPAQAGATPAGAAARAAGVPPQHLPTLDGLRGVAILLVMLHNMEFLDAPATPVAHGVALAFNLGWVGVQLFFVLSGFLITRILLQMQDMPGHYRVFFMRRVLRIFPLYYAALLVFMVLLPTLNGTPVSAQQQMWFWLYLVNWVEPSQLDSTLLPHFWSLAVEEQFYLAWPFLVFNCSPRRLAGWCLAMAVAVMALRVGMRLDGVNPEAIYMYTVSRMDALALGAAAAALTAMPAAWARVVAFGSTRLALVACALLALGVPATHGLYPRTDSLGQTVGYSVLAVAFTLLLLAGVVADQQRASGAGERWSLRWLRGGALCVLGKYSYGLYVLHKPLHDLVGKPWLNAHGLLPTGSVGVSVAYLTVAVVSCLALEMVVFRLLEAPFLALKRHFPAPA